MNGLSLNEMDRSLDEVAKKLGITKDQIRNMSETDLDNALDEKDNEKLDLSEDDRQNDEKQDEQNKDVLENLNAKQEINLDKKIDDRHTLADILGISAGSKLIVVNSDSILDNENTTRFSCLIKNADGSLEKADMLEQVGGKHSDKNIYETNRDGSRVENKVVQSTFAIDSDIVENGIISVRIGSFGTIEVGYGEIDRTSNKDAFTQKLETRETYPVTMRVREEFNQTKGIDNIPDKLDEIKEHEEHGCDHLTLDEADGDFNTGHIHDENVPELIISDKDVR